MIQKGIIVIDPGHGGIDGGAYKDGILEKEINLAISKKLKKYSEERRPFGVPPRDRRPRHPCRRLDILI